VTVAQLINLVSLTLAESKALFDARAWVAEDPSATPDGASLVGPGQV
jgi:hypothetical protein